MKTGAALILSAFLAALCGSFVDANGVCYDPDHTSGKNADSVAKDIQTIKGKGFTYVRTYISKFGNTKMVEQLAASGLQVVAGVPFKAGDTAEQIEAAVAAAGKGNVVTVMLGNENLAGVNSVPADFIQAIKDLKARLPGGVKVGTVQRNTEFLTNIGGLADLVAACDVIGVNIHPWFQGAQGSAANAMETTKSQWNKIIGSGVPGIADKLILGETGWPSAGSFGGNTGTVDGANAYFSAYKSWSASLPANKKFYFQLFDQPYKPEAYEKTYGLVTYDSQDKFSGASVPASTTAAPTSAPASTPASTPAPTPAPTATPASTAKNATSSSAEGSTSGSSSKDLKAAGSGSSAGSLSEAGNGNLESSSTTSETSSEESTSSTSETSGTQTSGTDAAAGTAVRTTVDTPFVDTDKNSGSSVEANVQSSESGSSGVTVAFAVVAGCAAVLGAFGFIYHTRKKAQELEEAEGKMSFAVTPHGGCVL